MRISVDVKSRFDPSEPLTAHIGRRLDTALHAHERHIRGVELRLSDANGPRRGDRDKVARIEISLKPSGRLTASAAAGDVYLRTRAGIRLPLWASRRPPGKARGARIPGGMEATSNAARLDASAGHNGNLIPARVLSVSRAAARAGTAVRPHVTRLKRRAAPSTTEREATA